MCIYLQLVTVMPSHIPFSILKLISDLGDERFNPKKVFIELREMMPISEFIEDELQNLLAQAIDKFFKNYMESSYVVNVEFAFMVFHIIIMIHIFGADDDSDGYTGRPHADNLIRFMSYTSMRLPFRSPPCGALLRNLRDRFDIIQKAHTGADNPDAELNKLLFNRMKEVLEAYVEIFEVAL